MIYEIGEINFKMAFRSENSKKVATKVISRCHGVEVKSYLCLLLWQVVTIEYWLKT